MAWLSWNLGPEIQCGANWHPPALWCPLMRWQNLMHTAVQMGALSGALARAPLEGHFSGAAHATHLPL